MSFVEGIRVDIYFLGIIILKMLGKMRLEEGDNLNMTSLLQIQDISVFYRKESLTDEMIDFLDVCFFDPQITLSELMMHNLVCSLIAQSDTVKSVQEPSQKTLTLLETSSKKSGTTNTSKVLKRYLTSGTNEGTSSEYQSDSSVFRTSVDTFKKTQSVLYEDSSFILKKLLNMKRKTTTFGKSPVENSNKSISKFLKVSTVHDNSSQTSSSPGSFSRHLDRTSDRNRIFIGEETKKHEPIYEEASEEDDEAHGSEFIKRVQSNTVKLSAKKLEVN